MKVFEDLIKAGNLLELTLTNQVKYVKVHGSLDCSDHEMVEFRIQRERDTRQITTLSFRRVDSGRDLLGRIPCKVLKKREIHIIG